MTKRLGIVVLALSATLALSGISAQSSSAWCLKTRVEKKGWFKAGCSAEEAKGNFAQVLLPVVWNPATGIWCGATNPNNKGWWATEACTGTEAEGRPFTQITGVHNFIAKVRGIFRMQNIRHPIWRVLGGPNVECESATYTGGENQSTIKFFDVTLKAAYSACELDGKLAKITEPVYEFDGVETMDIVGKPLVITSNTGSCSIKMEATSNKNSELGTVKYTNSGSTIKISADAVGIESESSGGICGSVKTAQKNVTYEDESVLEIEGGTIEWQ
jgi:hypothetical protein